MTAGSSVRAARSLVAGALTFAGLAAGPAEARAQAAPANYVELRAGRSRDALYRYVEYARFFPRGPVLDVVYFGAPGQNEVYAGAGYQVRAGSTLTVTPLLYGVWGKENGQRGLALGAVVLGTMGRWSVYAFAGYFEPLAGSVPRYAFVDSGDVSRKLGRFELGVSTGLFHAAGEWSGLAGPLLVWNDVRGAWRLAVRGGSSFEVRLGRTLAF